MEHTMKKSLLACAALIVSTVIASAAFVAPTQEQIDAAANDPTLVAALLTEATPAQAEAVLQSVLTVVNTLGLPPADLQTRAEAVLAAVVTFVVAIDGPTAPQTKAAIANLLTVTTAVLGQSVGTAVTSTVSATLTPALVPPATLIPYVQ
jgi:hypothetical protein